MVAHDHRNNMQRGANGVLRPYDEDNNDGITGSFAYGAVHEIERYLASQR